VKSILTIFLLGISLSVRAQYTPSNHADYLGVSIGTMGENYVRWEHSVTDKYVLLQGSIQAGENGLFLQYKLGVGYAPKFSRFRAYCFMPYFNLDLQKMSYNTPFSVEAFYDMGRWEVSLNLDIYPKGTMVIPSIRAKYRLFRFRM
jgi:hypothetical protein